MREFHAQLLHGPEQAALNAAARELAARAMCAGEDKPCHACSHCRKVEGGIHPDVITIEGESGKGLSIAAVRELQSDVLLRPNEGERKIYILTHADLMDARAQNALLKLLEDGPGYAMFFLLAQNPKAMLETVRSRCQLVSISGAPLTPTPEVIAEAEALIRLLERGDALTLLETTTKLEKRKREELMTLTEALLAQLGELAKQRGEPYLGWFDEVRQMRAGLDFNLSPAHLSGWLATL